MLEPGTIVGEKYRLEEPIGQGGMATVWRAVHTTLGRAVAVKFLEAVGTQSQQLAERFLQEAKLSANLRHRHVVDIMDFGVHDGQPFMVMELLVGQSLSDRYVEGPPVTDRELMEIVAMTLGGLAAVHDAGILHRDVKPENIFLVRDADGVFPKLLDFGVSRGLDGEGRFTKAGAVVGTPQYMSPEQARGKRDLDVRSDLFGVGVLLYEGFTGDVPFDSENPGDVLILVATQPHVPLTELRPDLPAEVIELVERALAKRREDRWPSARDMRDALFAILESTELASGRTHTHGSGLHSFPSGERSAKIRVLSAPPPAPSGSAARARSPLPTPSPRDALDALDAPRSGSHSLETPIELDAPELAAGTPVAIAGLPPTSVFHAPAERPSSVRAFVMGALVVLVAVAAVSFFVLDGVSFVSTRLNPAADSGAAGALRPGEVVAAGSAGLEEGRPVALAPPPTDGLPAPAADTVDVPSPPDPPEDVPEAPLTTEPPLSAAPQETLTVAVPAGPGRRRPLRRPRRR